MTRLEFILSIHIAMLFALTPKPALATPPTASSIAEALGATPEKCLRNEWSAELEQQFELETNPAPFLEAHLVNGFLCHNLDDLRQFLLLLGNRKFPTHLAKHMNIARAKTLAQEERAVQETQSGVRIVTPENPQKCIIEIEGVQHIPSAEMRSLPSRKIHVRYFCGDNITRKIVSVSPGSASIILPQIPHKSVANSNKNNEKLRADSEHFSQSEQHCSTGLALALNANDIGIEGPNNTKFPLFAKVSCSTQSWHMSVLMGEVERIHSPLNSQYKLPVAFLGGSIERLVAQKTLGGIDHQFSTGAGFWSATELLNPFQFSWNAHKNFGAWALSTNLEVGVPLQNPTKNFWILGLSAGTNL